MLWKEKQRSTIKTVQMDNLKGLLGKIRMDRLPNTRIRELCGMMKRVDEKIDKGGLAVWRGWRGIGFIYFFHGLG